jgi:hypothetical protein
MAPRETNVVRLGGFVQAVARAPASEPTTRRDVEQMIGRLVGYLGPLVAAGLATTSTERFTVKPLSEAGRADGYPRLVVRLSRLPMLVVTPRASAGRVSGYDVIAGGEVLFSIEQRTKSGTGWQLDSGEVLTQESFSAALLAGVTRLQAAG